MTPYFISKFFYCSNLLSLLRLLGQEATSSLWKILQNNFFFIFSVQFNLRLSVLTAFCFLVVFSLFYLSVLVICFPLASFKKQLKVCGKYFLNKSKWRKSLFIKSCIIWNTKRLAWIKLKTKNFRANHDFSTNCIKS